MNERDVIDKALGSSLRREKVEGPRVVFESGEIKRALIENGLIGERMKIPGKVFKTLEKSVEFYDRLQESLRSLLYGDLDDIVSSETGISPESIRQAKFIDSILTPEEFVLKFATGEGNFSVTYQKGVADMIISVS